MPMSKFHIIFSAFAEVVVLSPAKLDDNSRS